MKALEIQKKETKINLNKSTDINKGPLPYKKVFFMLLLLNTAFIIAGLLCGAPPEEVFGKEASFITWVSFAQLLGVSVISYKISKNRGKEGLLWLIVAVGFLFLSIDEVARIHENMDSIIHKKIFHIKETALTDRLDDLIIGIYALVGMGVLYRFRSELKNYLKSIPLFAVGFILIFLMVITELIANRYDLLPSLISNQDMAKNIYELFKIGEEALKLYAEAVLVTAFYICFIISKELQKI